MTIKWHQDEKISKNEETTNKIQNTLLRLGFTPNLQGFNYIIKANELITNNKYYIYSITKALYPKVSEYFGTTASKIERSMRHSIEVAWDKTLFSEFNEIGYGAETKPCNSEFLAVLNLYLKGEN